MSPLAAWEKGNTLVVVSRGSSSANNPDLMVQCVCVVPVSNLGNLALQSGVLRTKRRSGRREKMPVD